MTASEPQKEYDKEWRIHGSVCKKVMKALREAGRRDIANEFEADAIMNLGDNPQQECERVLDLISTYLSVHGVEERNVCGERLFVIPGSFQIHEFIRYIAELSSRGGGGG